MDEAEMPPDNGPWVVPLSAKSGAALRSQAARLADALDTVLRDARCADIAYSASCRRGHFAHRAAVVGNGHSQWIQRLRDIATSRSVSAIGEVHGEATLVMVFNGQGAQWPGMGSELFAREPVFRETILRCAQLIDARLSLNLVEEMFGRERTRLASTEVAQPALFALQVALAELWASWGVIPSAVLGHSVGEIAAAYTAGALTLHEAAALVCERGRLMRRAARGSGAMLHVALVAEDCRTICSELEGRIEIAASNGPQATTLSGERDAIVEAAKRLGSRGVHTKMLPTECAFHSAQMAGAAQELSRSLSECRPATPRIPLASTLTGQWAETLDANYWSRQVRECVRFREATSMLLGQGYSVFLEIGPQPVLRSALEQTIAGAGKAASVVTSMQRGLDQQDILCRALGELYCAGVPIRWERRYTRSGADVDLPTDAWEHSPPVRASEGAAAKTGARLVRLQESGDTPTHFWVHPVGGGIECYRELCRILPYGSFAFDQTVMTEAAASPETVQELAASYLKMIERERPATPFVLAGWSFGGLVAYEIALQLHARTGTLPPVVMLDTYILSLDEYRYGASGGRTLAQHILSASAGQRRGGGAGIAWEALDDDQVEHLHALFCRNLASARAYIPAPYAGSVLLVCASERLHDLGATWRPYASDLVVEEVEGDHYSILRAPTVRPLADKIHRHVRCVSRCL